MGLSAAQACALYKKRASEDATYWQSSLQDKYDYAMPFRQSAGLSSRGGVNTQLPGAKRTNKIYDSTAVTAVPRGAGKLKRAITPDFEQWALLVPGPMVDEGQRTRLAKELEDTTAIIWAVFSGSGFSVGVDGMYIDLFAGQGAMMVLKGDPREEICKFVSLATDRVVVDCDAFGRQRGWWYPIMVPVSEIEKTFPGAKLHKDLLAMRASEKSRDKDVELLLHCWRNGPRDYTWQVLWAPQNHEIFTEELRSTPFITPRFYVVPGESRGRGPLDLAMPHIKTLNKAVEMQLQAGAFALLGAWMTTDDQIYHPRKINLVPGGMVKVKRTGGPLGASLARLPVAEKFDLGSILIDELRMQIKEMLHDEPLPSDQGAVRSPTEIVARLKRLSQDINGAFGRLHNELFRPLIERVVDICQQFDLISERIIIDDYIMKVQVLSPLANTQMIEEVERTIRFYEILVATVGIEEARTFIDTEAWSLWLHERMGVTSKIVREPEKRAEVRKMNQEIRMAAAQAGVAPPEEDAGNVQPLEVGQNAGLAA